MKMKKALHKLLAMCMVVMSILFIMPNTISYAEQSSQTGDTITCKIKEFDMGNKTFKIELSTNASGCGIACAQHNSNSQGNMSMDEIFASATKEFSSTATFTVNEGVGNMVYAWIIDQDGNILSSNKKYSFSTHVGYAYYFLLTNYNPDIVYTNGDEIEYDANASIYKGILHFNILPQMTDTYVEVYSNNKSVTTRHYPTSDTYDFAGETTFDTAIESMNEAGTYEWRIITYKDNSYSKVQSITYDYVKPESKMPEVDITKATFEKGIVSFPAVEGAYGYTCYLYRSFNNGVSFNGYVSGSTRSNQYNSDVVTYDYSNYLQEGCLYKVGIRTLSNDITAIANSDELFTDVYDPSKEGEDVDNNLKDTLNNVLKEAGVDSVEKADADTLNTIYNKASDADKVTIAKALKEGLDNLDTNELKVALQTNSDTRASIEAIEKMYTETAGITVDKPDVSAEAGELIEAGGISVTGAGLNAAAGVTNVGLKITKEDAAGVDSTLYKNFVSLGITLNGADNVNDLAIPVQITMPIPKGVDISKLVILHLNADSTVNEKFTIANNGYTYDSVNRTITFTVTHFSTFIFAEADDTSTTPGNPTTPANPTTPENPTTPANPTTPENPTTPANPTTSGSSVTNPTTTAEPAQSQATETDNTAFATAETVTSSPKTGDNGSMAVLWVLFAGCAITAFCYAKKRVRR